MRKVDICGYSAISGNVNCIVLLFYIILMFPTNTFSFYSRFTYFYSLYYYLSDPTKRATDRIADERKGKELAKTRDAEGMHISAV